MDTQFCGDYIAIYDGPTEDSQQLLYVCGTQIPAVSETSTHQALVQFRSDNSGAGKNKRYSFLKYCFPESSSELKSRLKRH